MKPFGTIAFLLFLQFSCSSASLPKPFAQWKRNKSGKIQTEAKILTLATAGKLGHIQFLSSERIVNKVFDNADTNHDGFIEFSEAYELLLKLYITINQQAPIPPPSKKRVLQFFLNADTTHNNKLSRDEFKGLANVFAKRAISRVIAHKLVTLVGAPLLSEYLMNVLSGVGLSQLAKALIPERYQERLLPIITSPAFGRTVLIVLLVSTLGNIVMNFVNWILDRSLEDEDKDQRLKAYKDI